MQKQATYRLLTLAPPPTHDEVHFTELTFVRRNACVTKPTDIPLRRLQAT